MDYNYYYNNMNKHNKNNANKKTQQKKKKYYKYNQKYKKNKPNKNIVNCYKIIKLICIHLFNYMTFDILYLFIFFFNVIYHNYCKLASSYIQKLIDFV